MLKAIELKNENLSAGLPEELLSDLKADITRTFTTVETIKNIKGVNSVDDFTSKMLRIGQLVIDIRSIENVGKNPLIKYVRIFNLAFGNANIIMGSLGIIEACFDSRTTSPSQKALRLMHFFLPKDTREFLVGDICEDFPKQVERMGPRLAKAWVWKECLFAISNAALDWGISKFRALGGILRIGGGD